MPAVFDIRDAAENDRLLGFLFYYKRSDRFYIELLENVDEWSAPFLFFKSVKDGFFSIDSEWSLRWVRQRIVPHERQNISHILRDVGMDRYDEYRLILLSQGRCAQDDLYISKTSSEDLPDEIKELSGRCVIDVLCSNAGIYVFFKDGITRFIKKEDISSVGMEFKMYIADDLRFRNVRVSPGGHAIIWNDDREITAEKLRRMGSDVDISYHDITEFIKTRTIDTSEVCSYMNVSRQYVSQLVSEGSITPVKEGTKVNFFMKSEIERL